MSTPPSGTPPARPDPVGDSRDLGVHALALVLLAGSMILPWWGITATGAAGTISLEFGLGGICTRPANACEAYAALVAASPGYGPIAGTFGVAFATASVSLLGSLFALLTRLARGRFPIGASASVPASLGAGFAALAGTLYLFAALPATFRAASALPYGTVVEGFFGGLSTSEVTIGYGPSAGWWLSAGAAFLLIGPALIRIARARREPSS